MGIREFFKIEERATPIPNGSVPVSSENFFEQMVMFGGQSASGVVVNTDSALGVPAIWSAVNFLAGTLAGLPLNVYRRSGANRTKVGGPLATLLHDAVNEETSSFDWRKQMFESVFTTGRAFTFIERTPSGNITNFWLLDPSGVTVKRQAGRTLYEYKDDDLSATYKASEIIDIPFMLKPDGLGHRGPIATNKDVIGLGIAATNYGSRFFQNGGVPPFVVTGGFQSGAAMKRAADDLEDAVKKAAKEDRQALTLPTGLEIKPIGSDPEKSQLVELQRFMIEQIARIYSMPPTFLQDLTHGTFSNTEQQDLHFVKHTIKRWVEQFEQELNLKIFGRSRVNRFAELNMDGLLRGDFKSRMDGYATGIQNAILKPNEARRRENLPDEPDGDTLLVQGATVPIANQMKLPLDGEQEKNDGA